MKKKENKNVNTILSILESIPGILGFEQIVTNDEEIKSNDEVIKLEIKDNKISLSIGLIINSNVTTKIIEKQIFNSLSFYFKKINNNNILEKLNIYIKGVR